MTNWYLATQRFGTARGDAWERYLAWARLPHLQEVITLDGMLCPILLDVSAFTPDDWDHSVCEDDFCEFFKDADYLLTRFAGREIDANLLEVVREPTTEMRDVISSAGFTFYGYDVVEERGGVSALSNCGGFDKAFSAKDVNDRGLVDTLERAAEIRALLQKKYPGEAHAQCEIWAIRRYEKELP